MRTDRIKAHSGEVLCKAFIRSPGSRANALAHDLHVRANRSIAILVGKRAITPDTALRRSRYLRTTPAFWLHLQTAHDRAHRQGAADRT